jgi:hypothetical protein
MVKRKYTVNKHGQVVIYPPILMTDELKELGIIIKKGGEVDIKRRGTKVIVEFFEKEE